MSKVKLVVLYPYPEDVDAFERDYAEDLIPMVDAEALEGITKFIETRVLGTADGSEPLFYRIAELHFPSMEALQNAAAGEGARRAIDHAVSISSGGQPLFLIAEESVTEF